VNNDEWCVWLALNMPRCAEDTGSWRPILDNIESRFDSFLEQESRVNRQKVVDTRIHACLYFIQPTGHS
jgi:septin family protein